jgi:hypothetical protein
MPADGMIAATEMRDFGTVPNWQLFTGYLSFTPTRKGGCSGF